MLLSGILYFFYSILCSFILSQVQPENSTQLDSDTTTAVGEKIEVSAASGNGEGTDSFIDNNALYEEQDVEIGPSTLKPDPTKPQTRKQSRRCFKESEKAYFCAGDCCAGGTYLTCCPNNRPQCPDAVCCFNGVCLKGDDRVKFDAELPLLIQISLMDLKKRNDLKKYRKTPPTNPQPKACL